MKYIVTILLFAIASHSSVAQFAPYVFNTSFEEPATRTVGGAISYNSTSLSCFPYNNIITDTFARLGTRSLQSRLLSTDDCYLGSRRAEGQILKNGADSAVEDTWYAFSVHTQVFPFLLQSGLAAQWFNGAQKVNPNVALFVMPDASGQYMNWVLNLKFDTTNPNGSITQPRIILGRVAPGQQWTDFVFKINWKNNHTGYIDVYMGNPSKVATLINNGNGHTYSGATMNKQFNPAQPRFPTLRFGLYWFGWSAPGTGYAVQQLVMNYDVIKIGHASMPLDSFLIKPAATPLPPDVTIESNEVITLPTNTSTVKAFATTPQGSITTVQWTQTGGTTSTIVSPTNDTTVINGLTTAGIRTYKIVVTNTAGLKDSALVTVTVNAAPPVNQPPSVNPGGPQTITLPVSQVTLSGSASDPDGTVASYLWTKVSGTGGTITTPNSATTTVTGLTEGTYVFSLTATDNLGLTASGIVQITVEPAIPPVNMPPVVNAGSAQSITLPISQVTLTGSATDSDGSIASYLWTKVSGTGSSITTPSSNTTTVTGLSQGVYVYRLTATDNLSATGSNTVQVTVNPAPNVSPTSNAGSPQTIRMPISSVSLVGSGSDTDGTISSYLWTKVSGAGGTIVSPTSQNTNVTGLSVGSYIFSLRVTDNLGATGSATVQITVEDIEKPKRLRVRVP